MTNEEARETIKQFRDRQGNSSEDVEALDMAIKALEQPSVTDFSDKCKECGKILNDKLQTRWIPVSERLPEDGEYVLLYYERDAWIDNDCIRKKDIDKGWQIEGRWHVYGASGVVGIAWMPLPEPYKEGEE